jgi:hypothetical protein
MTINTSLADAKNFTARLSLDYRTTGSSVVSVPKNREKVSKEQREVSRTAARVIADTDFPARFVP